MSTALKKIAGMFCVFWILQIASFPVLSHTDEVITVAIDREYAPYEFVAADGTAQGFTPNLLRELAKEIGISIRFRPLAWSEAVKGLQTGDIDVVNMIHTREREKDYIFSKPHSKIAQSIFRHSGVKEIDGLDTLSGHTVALQENDISMEKLASRNDFEKVIVRSKIEGFLLLNLGKVDAFLASTHGGIHLIGEFDLENVELASGSVFPKDFAFAVKKDRHDLIRRLDAGLERLNASGRLRTLHERWLLSEVHKKSWIIAHAKSLLTTGTLLLFVMVVLLSRALFLRERAKRELGIEQKRLQEIIWGTNVGTWEWNVQTGETAYNERWAEIIGYSLVEISPVSIDTWRTFTHPDDLVGSDILLQKNFSRELEYYQCETRMRHKNGKWVWVLDRGKVVEWTLDGKPLRMSGTRTDITKQKHAETALYESKKDAEKANNAKSEFLAAMSHDLRTPLNAIMGFSEMMRTQAFGPLGDPRYEIYANDIHDSGSLLVNLINDVLDLAKVEAGKYELEDASQNVSALIEISFRQLRKMAETSDKTLRAQTPQNTPFLQGDRRVLIQILNNLISNAIKFSQDGGGIDVMVTQDTDHCIHISVVDTGIGMSENDIARALMPFEQADGVHSRRHEGTGLGLYLCVNFMKLFGGTLEIESEIDKGTQVTLHFPPERTIPVPD